MKKQPPTTIVFPEGLPRAESAALPEREQVAQLRFVDTSHSGPGIFGSTCVSKLSDPKYRHLIDHVPGKRRFEITYFDPSGKQPLKFCIPECHIQWFSLIE
jgi:hypothetical protein